MWFFAFSFYRHATFSFYRHATFSFYTHATFSFYTHATFSFYTHATQVSFQSFSYFKSKVFRGHFRCLEMLM